MTGHETPCTPVFLTSFIDSLAAVQVWKQGQGRPQAVSPALCPRHALLVARRHYSPAHGATHPQHTQVRILTDRRQSLAIHVQLMTYCSASVLFGLSNTAVSLYLIIYPRYILTQS